MSRITTDLTLAAECLSAGGLVAFPTETVYGLGADAASASAVGRIFEVKGRPADHPLIVHTSDTAAARYWLGTWSGDYAARHQESFERLAKAFWPGPLTLVVPRAEAAPAFACGGQTSIGLRCPSHALAQQLLKAFEALGGKGIAGPSANRFGRVSPTCAQHVESDLGDEVDLILDGGPCLVGIESTIVGLLDGRGPVLLRPGVIAQSALEKVLGLPLELPTASGPRVSGSLESHYAPVTPVELVAPAAFAWRLSTLADTGDSFAIYARTARPEHLHYRANLLWFQAPQDPAAYAQTLYDRLRALDQLGAQRIVIEDIPSASSPAAAQLWGAIRDRMKRAAA